jgi:hypothetical protein
VIAASLGEGAHRQRKRQELRKLQRSERTFVNLWHEILRFFLEQQPGLPHGLFTHPATHYPSFMDSSDDSQHNTTVRYETEKLGRVEGFDRKRVVQKDADAIFIASGPCPKCKAPGQQGIGYLRGRFKLAPWVEVVMECGCGFGHGEKDRTGCGRAWTVGALLEDWTLTDE